MSLTLEYKDWTVWGIESMNGIVTSKSIWEVSNLQKRNRWYSVVILMLLITRSTFSALRVRKRMQVSHLKREILSALFWIKVSSTPSATSTQSRQNTVIGTWKVGLARKTRAGVWITSSPASPWYSLGVQQWWSIQKSIMSIMGAIIVHLAWLSSAMVEDQKE